MHKHINSNMMHILLIWYHLFYLVTLNYMYALFMMQIRYIK
jgi:hypothetical protein